MKWYRNSYIFVYKISVPKFQGFIFTKLCPVLLYIPPRNLIRKQTMGVSYFFGGNAVEHTYIYFQGYFISRYNPHPTQQVFPSFYETFYQNFIYFPEFSKKKNLKNPNFQSFQRKHMLDLFILLKFTILSNKNTFSFFTKL